MTVITRRTFVGTAASVIGASVVGTSAVGVGLWPRRARAADFSLKYAHNVATSHPLHLRTVEAAEKINAETKGRVEIKIFPSSQLGGDTDMLSQVRSGALEFFTLSGLILSTLVPVASINGIGFAFKDYGEVWKAMDGDLGNHVRTAIGKVGLIAFDKMFDNGYRQTTTSTKPIQTPDDFKGLKIRVPVSPLWTSMFKDFGASPTSINFAEVYSALQTKVVEAQENPLAIINTGKLYEVQKYVSMTNHMWDGFHFLANARAFKALPEDVREVVTRNFNAAALLEREDVRKLNDGLVDDLKGKGLAINSPDPAPFRAALKQAGFYAEWRDKYGKEAWDLLERQVGALT
ncbi:MAG TPA: TRAP transporter substrate-binding protein [Stellaceae bacterium]|nr:TRAP transporter substrate-binding protein [Stellaceae bacterium]